MAMLYVLGRAEKQSLIKCSKRVCCAVVIESAEMFVVHGKNVS